MFVYKNIMEYTAEYARICFNYDPDEGKLRWATRPVEHYPTLSGWRKANTRFAGKVAGSETRKGYRRINWDGTVFYAHRVVWLLVYGEWPLGEIDHINGAPDDNRISNLRVVKNWENARNKSKPKRNTSGVVGVSWRQDLGRWAARIGAGRNSVALGFFDTKMEAIAARRGAEKVLEYHPNHGRE